MEILPFLRGKENFNEEKTNEFDLKSNLAYGGSEGIYLDLWIEYFVDGEKRTNSIGTFKTLDEAGNRLKWSYSCSNMETALKRKDELLEKHPQVIVRDNATRKEKVFKQPVQKEKEGNASVYQSQSSMIHCLFSAHYTIKLQNYYKTYSSQETACGLGNQSFPRPQASPMEQP